MEKDPAQLAQPFPADGSQMPSEPPPELLVTESQLLGDATDLFFNTDPKPSDDTPTIISKLPPRPASSEEVWNGSLPRPAAGPLRADRADRRRRHGGGAPGARHAARPHRRPEDPAAGDGRTTRRTSSRFHQEARAAAKLDHENIARVFFCGEDQGLHFIAFEFVEGDNLRHHAGTPRPAAGRRGACTTCCRWPTGLAHAAERGVVHRDIKPSNIIITPNGRAKLVDMGLARSLEPQADDGLTQSGVTLGTFDYISPEQALEPRDADVRSDIYSLGCTFYHMLTGQPPVPEGTAAKKLHHHQHVEPLDPRQLNPDIPDEVAAILGRMMAKDPTAPLPDGPSIWSSTCSPSAQKLGAARRTARWRAVRRCSAADPAPAAASVARGHRSPGPHGRGRLHRPGPAAAGGTHAPPARPASQPSGQHHQVRGSAA